MNTTPQKSYFQRIVLPFIVGMLFIVGFLLIGLHTANLRRNLPDPFAPYDPATFGIPEILAGYRILAIKSADNTACMPDNFQDVLVQAVDPMPDNPLVAKGNGDVLFELKKFNPNVRWGLGGIMPVPFDRAGFASQQESWNRSMKNGCPKFGGPIILITDTPADPFAPYDPLTFGIPEIVAGYRIVAVHSSDNTPCTPPNTMRLIIQAVDPSPDNPMVAVEGGDVVFEVKNLHPDIEVSLQYIMPVPFNRPQFVALMEDWNSVGCVILGGPMPTITDMPDLSP